MIRRPPLDAVNDRFHRGYDAARTAAVADGPVLIQLPGSLVLVRESGRSEIDFEPTAYHALKSAAHGPVALYAILHRHGDGPLDGATRKAVAGLVRSVERARDRIDADFPDPTHAREVRELLDATLDFAGTDAVDCAELERFAGRMGPRLLALTDHATRAQLDALHAAVEALLQKLDPEELDRLRVVVAGVHQARSRSSGMQYFRARLGEPDGAEERVTYAENVETEQEALELVGTQRLDRAIAAAFFGDAKRLQRDVLGDAAARWIQEHTPGQGVAPSSAADEEDRKGGKQQGA